MRIATSFADDYTTEELDTTRRTLQHQGYKNIHYTIINHDGGKKVFWYGTRGGTCTCELEGHCPVCG